MNMLPPTMLHPKFQGECQGVVGASNPLLSPEIEVVKQRLLDKYATSVFTPHLHQNCPSRGPNCEATIHLIPGAVPVNHRFYQMTGERRQGCIDIADKFFKEDLFEPSLAEWSSPAFVVPKKVKGVWRLVIDYRYLNSVTRLDAHPLPRIGDI